MPGVTTRLAGEIQAALKAGDRVRVATLRLLSAAVKNREIELRRELSDPEFVEVVQTQVKRRREAAEAYERGGREDRAAREREEEEILSAYLPAQWSEEEIDAAIEEAVAATGATGPQDFGRVMGLVMGRGKGRVDGATVSRKLKARLAAEPG